MTKIGYPYRLMTCHLVQKDEFNSINELTFGKSEHLAESNHFGLSICGCTLCGQQYVSCFVEVCLTDGDDDCWTFWAPLTSEEIESIRRNWPKAIDLIQNRKHIVWHPDGKIYWNEGPEIALIRGPG